ncbi:MAG TPA: hypothetical protein VJ276_10695, partial [Thermoanaerobaculia bacterium]|nr:hypothetical protein [Thermoanaerobaculia bacterium]
MNTRAVAIAFATLFVALRATAQGNDKALETIARAETMATAGDTAGALTLLEKGKSGCPSPDYHDCNVLYNFALGYLWTVQAGRTHAMEDRNQAFDAFARVLSVDPDNADTWINIAHLQQLAGHAEEAADAFSRAEAAEGDAMGRYFFAAAETLRQAGNLSRSEELFRRAGEAGAVDAWPELVALKAERIRRMEAGPRTIELLRALDLAHELRDRQASGAASEALELVIAESFADWPVIAESALEEWAENHAKNATLTGAALKRLPSLEQWKSAMLLQLAESVQQRTWRFRDEWIRAGESRRHAAIEASVAIANDAVGRGDLESAETLFEAARIYEDSPVIELQLARIALARHDEAGFNAVIDRLYGAKESAYQTKDRPAEQELHVVLGAIYKERGIWKSRDEDVGRNATFH